MKRDSANVREQILKAGLKLFAERGYAGASVNDIIEATKVTKPVLYYHFESKAGLYKALLDEAFDDGYRRMQEAAQRATEINAQLVEVFDSQFEFLRRRRDLVRLAIGATFAAPGELPRGINSIEKGARNFEFVHTIVRQAQERGELSSAFSSLELAHGIYGALCFHLMAGAVEPQFQLSRQTARRILTLFLEGAKPTKTRA